MKINYNFYKKVKGDKVVGVAWFQEKNGKVELGQMEDFEEAKGLNLIPVEESEYKRICVENNSFSLIKWFNDSPNSSSE